MAACFATSNAAGLEDIQAAHHELSERFRADLYVTRQVRPLLRTTYSSGNNRRRLSDAGAKLPQTLGSETTTT